MTNGGRSCSLCDSKEHLTFQCSAFKEISSSERRKRVKGCSYVLTVFLQDTNLSLVKAATHAEHVGKVITH